MYCINCGKEVIKNSKFCKHCGFKIHESGNNEFVENMYTSINNNELNVKENILLKCKGCNENFNKNDLDNGYCEICSTDEIFREEPRKESNLKDLEKIDTSDGKVESDSLDNYLGIKGSFSKNELSKKRFEFSYIVLYLLSIFNIALGIYIHYSNNSLFSALSGVELLNSGIIYLILTFSFHKLLRRMNLATQTHKHLAS